MEKEKKKYWKTRNLRIIIHARSPVPESIFHFIFYFLGSPHKKGNKKMEKKKENKIHIRRK